MAASNPDVIEPEDHEGMIDLENARIPDVLGEVIGWRAWYVVKLATAANPKGEARLQSLGGGGPQGRTLWKPGETMEAYCVREHEREGGIPGEKCSCGFYAARTREHLVSLNYNRYDVDDPARVVVIGRVAMHGKVIPGSQGWRAQKAKPVELLVPFERWRWVQLLQAAYPDIPTSLDNTFRAKEGGR